MADSRRRVTVELDKRDLNALKWAPTLIRGIEDANEGISGIREGEAMSDVLAAIYRRIEAALSEGALDG